MILSFAQVLKIAKLKIDISSLEVENMVINRQFAYMPSGNCLYVWQIGAGVDGGFL
jgi:hypothetical protein